MGELDVKAHFRMKSDTEFVREEPEGKRYGLNQLQPSVGDSGAPVFTFKENRNKYSDYNDDGKVKFRDDIKHAILIGIISQSQYLAEAAQDDEGEERQQMSDQMISRIQPV